MTAFGFYTIYSQFILEHTNFMVGILFFYVKYGIGTDDVQIFFDD